MAYGDKLRDLNQYENANDQCDVGAVEGIATQPCEKHRPSERVQAEKRVGHHRAEAERADRAVAFFREHPEFDEFIGLVRAGAISI